MRCRACSPVSYRYFSFAARLCRRVRAARRYVHHGAVGYFVNLDTGIVVFEQNADEQRSVASLTKLMTALLLMENVSDLESTMIKQTAIYIREPSLTPQCAPPTPTSARANM